MPAYDERLHPDRSTGLADKSNGYEALAEEFMSGRNHSAVGVATVREWAKALPRGATVLDLGCGHGVPISQALMEEGLQVYGVDASPSMIAGFLFTSPWQVCQWTDNLTGHIAWRSGVSAHSCRRRFDSDW